jgi:acyl phosphate:glycerol-3-phosphate acyltransferase
MSPWLAVLAAYAVGSFPSAYLAGRALRGVDLRTIGSGNLGATNVYRELGPVPAVAVLVIDAFKGFAPVFWLPSAVAVAAQGWWAVAIGAAAIAGHVRPFVLLGRGGGKGVATAAGVFAALSPVALGGAVAAFALVVGLTRIVSLGSITAALVLPVLIAFRDGADGPVFAVSGVLAAFIVFSHRTNIARLRRGEEPQLGRTRRSV